MYGIDLGYLLDWEKSVFQWWSGCFRFHYYYYFNYVNTDLGGDGPKGFQNLISAVFHML